MKKLPSREQSEQLLRNYIRNEGLLNHCFMVARAMEAYARELSQDEELWYQSGLLHDIDWEKYPDQHPLYATSTILINYPDELINAVLAHGPSITGRNPETLLERYLFACDEISGFINAVSLMRPTRFEGMEPKSVVKRLKDKSFAAKVSREDITMGCVLIQKELTDHIAFLIGVFERK
ncbi:HDIG domain-containing protein [Candidatus Roizmanbacteria bacterium]|nr:HDIG domain-containing protein [Candidatus Roizmanbacteria bacterium]